MQRLVAATATLLALLIGSASCLAQAAPRSYKKPKNKSNK